MAHEFEVRLIGSNMPAGEIALATLANLAEGLQELTLRIGRDRLPSPGSGRTAEVITSLTSMRLVGLAAGSTRLRFARGPVDELDLDLTASGEIDARFWEILDGVAANSRPPWVTDLIADSTRKFVAALLSSAREVELTGRGRQPIKIATAALRAEVWQPGAPDITASDVVVTGRLEAVDLRSGRFRVVDDVGNRFNLDHVPDPVAVAHLINHRVRAVGSGRLDPTGHLKGLDSPFIEAQELPASWLSPKAVDLGAELAKPGPKLGGGVELTDDEFDEFMATIKG
ncbi:hypothetical protein MSHI_18640 [Mycobacterium shinjukuense]|uniref:Uncharacterized protein n=2 Tax=Mycobacterium shinjukuense TaxID=398694 RepID=A0A7I7MP01_9MYCO|nr:hypothetical protein MSHI_18640 [Mycobacterium shinjukuense]